MLKPTLIARGAVFSAAASRDGSAMAWSNRTDRNRDIFLRQNGETVQLTDDAEIDTEPTLSPDGSHLVWSRRVEGDWDLFHRTAEGSVEPLFSAPGAQRKPRYSGDGSTLVFEDDGAIGVLRDGRKSWLGKPRGTEVSRNPQVSHDGSRVFYERFDQATRETTLWMRDQNGTEKPLLTPEDGWTGFAVSRNGRQLTYSVFTEKGEDLKVWHLDTDEVEDLADKEDVNESFPSVTPDGRTTYYTLADFRGWPKVDTYIFQDEQGRKEELVTRDPEGRHLFSHVTGDGSRLHWMWIDDADPLNRALYTSPL